MLYLEHLNLVVKDIPQALKFYQVAFPHWRIRGEGQSTWYGKPRRWLHFGDDDIYLALSDHGESDIRDNRAFQVGLSHFAFVTNELTNITQRLMAAGFVGVQGDGAAGVRNNTYFIDSDGYEIELVEYLTADIGQKNDY
ncbi:VOC family protein [Colwellia sp. M166]|uniref:VOC family protein n=1 Tax=Colwellia sp. M166 TaxID=2583805 RepID=UPI00211E72A2|nr:VOC family protein [Colwellia sp. M166]UUO24875.1 VOC family protein [Colwellia sp. M166]|tara:strand:+ start:7075 stop:7491 length:417 start_codon:yes stop_codon:yes gene_type:complete